jgi:hypothetical protein
MRLPSALVALELLLVRIFRLDRAARIALLTCAVLATFALGTSAQVASAETVGEKIILRCTHNESLSGFSLSAYRQALRELVATTEEYSECSSLIRKAELAAASAGRGGGGGGQSAAPPVALAATPSQQKAIARATGSRPEAVKLGNQTIKPGVVHVDVASALSSLPTPLLATLAFLLACLLLVIGGVLRNRVRGHAD